MTYCEACDGPAENIGGHWAHITRPDDQHEPEIPPPCECPCHAVIRPGLVPCPQCANHR